MPPAATLYAENLALKERVGGLEERIAVLQKQIEWFKRKLFGCVQSEKLAWMDVAQLELAMAELERLTLPVSKTETITYERAKPSPEKRAVPVRWFDFRERSHHEQLAEELRIANEVREAIPIYHTRFSAPTDKPLDFTSPGTLVKQLADANGLGRATENYVLNHWPLRDQEIIRRQDDGRPLGVRRFRL